MSHKQRVIASPRVRDSIHKFIEGHFKNKNCGVTYILESFPNLYAQTLTEIKGVFTKDDLLLMINGLYDTPLIPYHTGLQLASTPTIKDECLEALLGMSAFQQAVLEIWASSYWLNDCNDLDKYIERLV